MVGVKISPSDIPKYKLKVTMKNGRIIHCGACGYADYPTYIKLRGKKYATQRRRLYKQRHRKDRFTKGTPGYYADQLLW
jgi:hypothetical protein